MAIYEHLAISVLRYEDVTFKMPDEQPEGLWKPKGDREIIPTSIRIAVHYGPKEELIAMATVDMEDLRSLVCTIVCVFFLCAVNNGNFLLKCLCL